MPPPAPDEVSAAVDGAAAALKLKISAQHRPGVLRFYALAAQMAELVEGLPLTPADEAAVIFHPVAPETGE